MKRGINAVIFLTAIAALAGCGAPPSPKIAGRISAPPPFTYWYGHTGRAQSVCGPPTGPVQWHGGRATLKTASCTLQLHEWYVRMSRPAPTATPVSRPTETPTPPPFVFPTPTNAPVPVPAASCTSLSGCTGYLLSAINQERASHGYAPLTLDATLSNGSGSCIGAQGHASDMAKSGTIWHQDSDYPTASFPADICGSYRTAGQNVGVGAQGSLKADVDVVNQEMMTEPWTPGCIDDHACNLLSASYSRIGIGLATGTYSGYSALFLVESFAG